MNLQPIRTAFLALGLAPIVAFAQSDQRTLARDRSKPVPSKDEIIAAWRKRQSAIATFRFAWTEDQTHRASWLSNPRYPERERAAIPGLLVDRHYVVTKTLAVSDNRMRYSFTIDRKAEPDGISEIDPGGRRDGLGVRRHYSYLSVFDGQAGETRLTSLEQMPPPTSIRTTSNIDAQNLDVRPWLMAFRPLDPVMGHLLIERAITNQARTFYKGKSTFLLEERHDPMGWKTILTIEPERDFLISRYVLLFEQKAIVDMDIDYVQDARWGWVPSGWRLTEMLADGSRRLVSVAHVTSYEINVPMAADEFRR
jgi:hypothetical protein